MSAIARLAPMAAGAALFVGALVALVTYRPKAPASTGAAGVRAELTTARESVEVAPVTATTDWDAHVETALATTREGKTYTTSCLRCRGRRIPGGRSAALAHLITVHGPERSEHTALLDAYDRELTP